MSVLTLIFWGIGLIFGVLMFLQTYAWNWEWWKCLIFAVVMTVAAVLVLGACKSLVLKLAGRASGLLAAVKAKLG